MEPNDVPPSAMSGEVLEQAMPCPGAIEMSRIHRFGAVTDRVIERLRVMGCVEGGSCPAGVRRIERRPGRGTHYLVEARYQRGVGIDCGYVG